MVLVVCRSIPQTIWGWLGAVSVGFIGGWLGGWLTELIVLEAVNWLGSLVIAFVGALGLLLILPRVAPNR